MYLGWKYSSVSSNTYLLVTWGQVKSKLMLGKVKVLGSNNNSSTIIVSNEVVRGIMFISSC